MKVRVACQFSDTPDKADVMFEVEDTGIGISEAQQGLPEASEEEISSESKTHLPKLLGILEREFVPQWELINEMLMMDEVEIFAAGLEKVAQQYNIRPLAFYSHALCEEAHLYDVRKVENRLAGFPQLIQHLKDLQKE